MQTFFKGYAFHEFGNALDIIRCQSKSNSWAAGATSEAKLKRFGWIFQIGTPGRVAHGGLTSKRWRVVW